MSASEGSGVTADTRQLGHLARRFRPAVETSLDVFEAMLAPMQREMEPV
jgi:hypothetical protein